MALPEPVRTIVGAAEIAAARESITGVVHRTRTVRSTYLSERLGLDIVLKLELEQKTGSFKVRGALHRVAQLTSEERQRGVITVSAGNHAQAVAWAARRARTAATVLMPETAVQSKIDATRGYGATVELVPPTALLEHLERRREETGAVFIPPFDDAHVIAGAATCGAELMEDHPALDAVLVGVGGGGIVSGLLAAARAAGSRARVIGVEPTGADAMTRSLAAGSPVRLERVESIADGLSAPWAGTLNYQHVVALGGAIVTVPDRAIAEAMWLLMERCKVFAEPAAAAGLAALLSGAVTLPAGARTAIVVTGGNIDHRRLGELAVLY